MQFTTKHLSNVYHFKNCLKFKDIVSDSLLVKSDFYLVALHLLRRRKNNGNYASTAKVRLSDRCTIFIRYYRLPNI